MTDAQDLILDKLVGSKVGADWPDGPLALAAGMLDGSDAIHFGTTASDRGTKAEIAKRLGYPVLLCEAIQGAVRGFKAEEDRRSFAMLVFRAVVIPGRPRKLSSEEQIRIAEEVAARTHATFCRPDCPAGIALARATGASDYSADKNRIDRGTECVYAGLELRHGDHVNDASSPGLRLAQSLNQALAARLSGRSRQGWKSLRESLRLVATERGVGEAARLCVAIASRCGLAAEEV